MNNGWRREPPDTEGWWWVWKEDWPAEEELRSLSLECVFFMAVEGKMRSFAMSTLRVWPGRPTPGFWFQKVIEPQLPEISK